MKISAVGHAHSSAPSVVYGRARHLIATALLLAVSLHAGIPVQAADAVEASGDASLLSVLLVSVSVALGMAVLIIIGLVHWGHKQEFIEEMMHLCMRHLMTSDDAEERCSSARALGRLNNESAFLVLLDVVLDEDETESVREAAREALYDMCDRNSRFLKMIADFEFESELKNYEVIIEMLIDNFERGGRNHTQSAFIIGQQFMHLKRFVDAREWLVLANNRNSKRKLYGNQIREWIDLCNIELIKEGDKMFRKANYHQARERYSYLDHELSDTNKRFFSIYLRLTCVYCKLGDYQNADQALLQALNHDQGTDLALSLVPMLQQITLPSDGGADEKIEKPRSRIDSQSSEIMQRLLSKNYQVK